MSKPAPKPKLGAVASSLATFTRPYHDRFVDTFTDAHYGAIDAAVEREGIAESLRTIIFDMREASADAGAYLSAVEALLGNGLKHTQKDYSAGSVAQALKDAGVTAAGVSTHMRRARHVARYVSDGAVFEKAQANGETFRSMSDVMEAKKPPRIVPDKEIAKKPSAATSVDVETDEQIVARIGCARALRAVAAILKADNATKLAAATLDALVKKLG